MCYLGGGTHKTRRCRGVTYPESYITKYTTYTKRNPRSLPDATLLALTLNLARSRSGGGQPLCIDRFVYILHLHLSIRIYASSARIRGRTLGKPASLVGWRHDQSLSHTLSLSHTHPHTLSPPLFLPPSPAQIEREDLTRYRVGWRTLGEPASLISDARKSAVSGVFSLDLPE